MTRSTTTEPTRARSQKSEATTGQHRELRDHDHGEDEGRTEEERGGGPSPRGSPLHGWRAAPQADRRTDIIDHDLTAVIQSRVPRSRSNFARTEGDVQGATRAWVHATRKEETGDGADVPGPAIRRDDITEPLLPEESRCHRWERGFLQQRDGSLMTAEEDVAEPARGQHAARGIVSHVAAQRVEVIARPLTCRPALGA